MLYHGVTNLMQKASHTSDLMHMLSRDDNLSRDDHLSSVSRYACVIRVCLLITDQVMSAAL